MTHDTQTSPQQRGESCQIDNCSFGPLGPDGQPTPGAADIWVAIRGTMLYADDEEPETHFNVWICRAHYEKFTTLETEVSK